MLMTASPSQFTPRTKIRFGAMRGSHSNADAAGEIEKSPSPHQGFFSFFFSMWVQAGSQSRPRCKLGSPRHTHKSAPEAPIAFPLFRFPLFRCIGHERNGNG